MATLDFTPAELETLRVALLSAHYSAMDEERHHRRVLADLDAYGAAEGVAVAGRAEEEDARAKAAGRANAYHILAERVMAAQTPRPL